MNLKNELIKMAAARVIEWEAAKAQQAAEEEAVKQASAQWDEESIKEALAQEILKAALYEALQEEQTKQASEGDQLIALIKQAAEEEQQKEAINKKLLAGLAAALGLGGAAYAGGLFGGDDGDQRPGTTLSPEKLFKDNDSILSELTSLFGGLDNEKNRMPGKIEDMLNQAIGQQTPIYEKW